MHKGLWAARFLLLVLLAVLVSCKRSESPHQNWGHYRSDLANSAYSSLEEVNIANVKDLKVAWTFHTGDADSGNRSAIQCNPLLANGTLYITSPRLKLFALDPASGAVKWVFDPFPGTDATGVNRGVTFWERDDDKRIYFAAGPYLSAIG